MEYGEAINKAAAARAFDIASRLRGEGVDRRQAAIRGVASAYCVCVTDGEDAAERQFSPIHARLVDEIERRLQPISRS